MVKPGKLLVGKNGKVGGLWPWSADYWIQLCMSSMYPTLAFCIKRSWGSTETASIEKEKAHGYMKMKW